MGIRIAWDDEAQSICRIEFDKPFNWADYHDAVNQLWATVKTVDHPVDIIGSFASGSSLPRGFPLLHLQRSTRTQPRNIRTVVMVNFDPYSQSLILALAKLNRAADTRA